MIPDLAIYTRLLPATRMALMASDGEEKRDQFELIEDALTKAVLFDCRQLPLGFIEDTGEAALGDLLETREKFTLPYDECYFEFPGGFCAVAWHMDVTIAEPESEVEIPTQATQVYGFLDIPKMTAQHYGLRMAENDCRVVSYPNVDMLDGPDYLATLGISDPDALSATDYANYLVVGAVTLLADKLVLETIRPDSKPYLNANRRAKGKPPISGPSRVLTVNVPAVRYAAAHNNSTGSHASPALHWRRGHKRTLPRTSDDQPRTTWVRRCLVGDPGKGYTAPKGYRLILDKRVV